MVRYLHLPLIGKWLAVRRMGTRTDHRLIMKVDMRRHVKINMIKINFKRWPAGVKKM